MMSDGIDTEETVASLVDTLWVLFTAEEIHKLLPGKGVTSREFSLALTKMQEARMWFTQALIERYGEEAGIALIQEVLDEYRAWGAPLANPPDMGEGGKEGGEGAGPA